MISRGVLKENFLGDLRSCGRSSRATLPSALSRATMNCLSPPSQRRRAFVDQDRRAAVAVDRGVAKLSVAPDDLAVEVEAGRALMAEMDVETFAVGERRRAGMAVLAWMRGRLGRPGERPPSARERSPWSRPGRAPGATGPCPSTGTAWSGRLGHPARSATTSPCRESAASRPHSWSCSIRWAGSCRRNVPDRWGRETRANSRLAGSRREKKKKRKWDQ